MKELICTNDKIVLLTFKVKDIEIMKIVVEYFYTEKVSIRITEIYNMIHVALLLPAGNFDSQFPQGVRRCVTDPDIANSG